MDHPWLKSTREHKEISSSASSSSSKLGNTTEEMLLAAKLEACGFNVPQILHSVHTNACNQLSALWHLLLEKDTDTSSNSSFELHTSDVDQIFERTHQQPTLNQNPLLQIAASEKAPPVVVKERAKTVTEKERVGGRRKKEVMTMQTSASMTGGLLRVSERMKTMGIEEEEEGFLMTPTKTSH